MLSTIKRRPWDVSVSVVQQWFRVNTILTQIWSCWLTWLVPVQLNSLPTYDLWHLTHILHWYHCTHRIYGMQSIPFLIIQIIFKVFTKINTYYLMGQTLKGQPSNHAFVPFSLQPLPLCYIHPVLFTPYLVLQLCCHLWIIVFYMNTHCRLTSLCICCLS